jgi:RNA polymerase sigma-70 factor (ECF subfamily)
MTDAELVTQSQQGDLQAFNRLAGKWHAGLYHFVHRTLGNAEEAQDVCQEALLKAYLNIQRLRDPGKFRAWLHHIALNLCRDWHRSAKSRPSGPSIDEVRPADLLTGVRGATDERAERNDLLAVVREALEGLSLEQRTAILLREYQGFTSQEIAEITGVPAATVRTRIFYGLKSLRRTLDARGIRPEQFGAGGLQR